MQQLPHNQVAGTWDECGGMCVEKRLRKMVEIREEQYGFVASKETIDAIFILRQLQEKYLENDKELYLIFVDLEKASDWVLRVLIEREEKEWWSIT